jgi:hypothetical protein
LSIIHNEAKTEGFNILGELLCESNRLLFGSAVNRETLFERLVGFTLDGYSFVESSGFFRVVDLIGRVLNKEVTIIVNLDDFKLAADCTTRSFNDFTIPYGIASLIGVKFRLDIIILAVAIHGDGCLVFGEQIGFNINLGELTHEFASPLVELVELCPILLVDNIPFLPIFGNANDRGEASHLLVSSVGKPDIAFGGEGDFVGFLVGRSVDVYDMTHFYISMLVVSMF